MTETAQQRIDKFIKSITANALLAPIRTVAFTVGEQIRNRISMSPGPSHSPVAWASKAQQRYYFLMRFWGGPDKIPPPGTMRTPGQKPALPAKYKRTNDPMSQKLEHSWVTERTPVGAIVGTRVTYAAEVQSSEKQQPMHVATGWKTDKQAYEEVQQSGVIDSLVGQALTAHFGAI